MMPSCHAVIYSTVRLPTVLQLVRVPWLVVQNYRTLMRSSIADLEGRPSSTCLGSPTTNNSLTMVQTATA